MFEPHIDLLLGGSVLALFLLEYALGGHRTLRKLPYLWLLLPIGLACAAPFGSSGGFIDLTALAVFLYLLYAALCLVAILLGRLVWWLVHRTKSDAKR